MKNNSYSIKLITYTAMYCAIIIVMSLIPFTGFILFMPGFKITTIGLVITIATWHVGWVGAIGSSFAFGLGSFISGALFPSLLGSFFYEFPWIAFVPRIVLGISLAIVVKLLKNFSKFKFILSIVIGALLNTILVVGSIYIAGKGETIGLIILANVGVEAIVVPILAIPIVPFVEKIINDFKIAKKISW